MEEKVFKKLIVIIEDGVKRGRDIPFNVVYDEFYEHYFGDDELKAYVDSQHPKLIEEFDQNYNQRNKMVLMTPKIKYQLPRLYHYDDSNLRVDEYIAICKFFAGQFTWYILEGSMDKSGEWLLFCYVYNANCPEFSELGYVSLSELESVRGPYGLRAERDYYFKEKKLGEIKASLNRR